MIVSVGIFALVMLVATSTYFTLITVDRRARATNQVVNNISFAIDAMTRGIRTGTNYKCQPGGGNDISGSCSCFSYTDTGLNTPVTYHLMANHTIGRTIGSASCPDDLAVPITDPAITVSKLVFYVRGVGTTTSPFKDEQPQVLFTVLGTMPADSSGNTASFSIEGGATERLIDL
jgi:type II secretory pathway pseudopilin PulG